MNHPDPSMKFTGAGTHGPKAHFLTGLFASSMESSTLPLQLCLAWLKGRRSASLSYSGSVLLLLLCANHYYSPTSPCAYRSF